MDQVHQPPERNPPVPRFLRLVTTIECAVVGWAAFMMFWLPAVGFDLWAWATPPFNSRYIGAVYWAAFVPLALFAAIPRWSPGRVVLWMIGTFTTTIMVVMVVYAGQFVPGRFHTWVFWGLYLFLPFNTAAFLYRLRRSSAGAQPSDLGRRVLLLAVAIGLGGYGIGLLIAPETLTAFWPWPVDAFHGRIYAATFLTPAVGAVVLLRGATPLENLAVGSALFILGVFSIAGTLVTSAQVPAPRKVDLDALGTWAFLAGNAIIAITGAVIGLTASAVHAVAAAVRSPTVVR